MSKVQPRKLTDRESRRRARWARNRQWQFMERIAGCGKLWFCVWNKERRDEGPDEWRDGLITGLEIMGWIARHRDWFIVGRWSNKRDARPIRLTDAGRRALRNRARYDTEPVFGGMVEPGWQAIPTRTDL